MTILFEWNFHTRTMLRILSDVITIPNWQTAAILAFGEIAITSLSFEVFGPNVVLRYKITPWIESNEKNVIWPNFKMAAAAILDISSKCYFYAVYGRIFIKFGMQKACPKCRKHTHIIIFTKKMAAIAILNLGKYSHIFDQNWRILLNFCNLVK